MSRNPRAQKNDDRRHQAATLVSTRQIATVAVCGGPKTVKKDKRPAGHGRKG